MVPSSESRRDRCRVLTPTAAATLRGQCRIAIMHVEVGVHCLQVRRVQIIAARRAQRRYQFQYRFLCNRLRLMNVYGRTHTSRQGMCDRLFAVAEVPHDGPIKLADIGDRTEKLAWIFNTNSSRP